MQGAIADSDHRARWKDEIPVGRKTKGVLRKYQRGRDGRRAAILGGSLDSPKGGAVDRVEKVTTDNEISAGPLHVEPQPANVRDPGRKLEGGGPPGLIGEPGKIIERFRLDREAGHGVLPGGPIRKHLNVGALSGPGPESGQRQDADRPAHG